MYPTRQPVEHATTLRAILINSAMPWWDKHLFGKRRTPEELAPAGEVALRVHRASMNRGFREIPVVATAGLIGWNLWWIAITFAWFFLLMPVAPASRLTMTLEEIRKQRPLWSLAKVLASIGFIWLWFRLLMPQLVGAFAPVGYTQRRASHNRHHRRSWRRFAWWGAMPILLVCVVGVGVDWRASAMMTSHALAFLGPALMAVGLTQRRGARLHCASCSYPMGSWRRAPERCPECGKLWKSTWGAIVGEKTFSRDLFATGVAMFVVAVMLAVGVGHALKP